MTNVILTQQVGQIQTKEIEQLLNSMMSGKIEMPLVTQVGETICDQNGVAIYAVKYL